MGFNLDNSGICGFEISDEILKKYGTNLFIKLGIDFDKKVSKKPIIVYPISGRYNLEVFTNALKLAMKLKYEYAYFSVENNSPLRIIFTGNDKNDEKKPLEFFLAPYVADFGNQELNPIKILRDNQNRYHSLEEAAVQYREVSNNLYFIRGARFEKAVWEKIRNKEITPEEVLKFPNLEQRRAVIQHIGYEILIDKLKPRILDSYVTKNKKAQEIKYEVLEIDLKDEINDGRIIPARFIKVQDHTTLRIYLLRVPPIKQTEKCDGAIAWTFGFEQEIAEEFRPLPIQRGYMYKPDVET